MINTNGVDDVDDAIAALRLENTTIMLVGEQVGGTAVTKTTLPPQAGVSSLGVNENGVETTRVTTNWRGSIEATLVLVGRGPYWRIIDYYALSPRVYSIVIG